MKKIRLEDIDKKAPFKVPNGYFDRLMVDIQEKVAVNPRRHWVYIPQIRWALASSFALVLVALIVFYPRQTDPSIEQMLTQVTDEELIQYLDMNDLSEYEIIDGVADDEIEALWEEDAFQDLDLEDSHLDELITDYEIDNLL